MTSESESSLFVTVRKSHLDQMQYMHMKSRAKTHKMETVADAAPMPVVHFTTLFY